MIRSAPRWIATVRRRLLAWYDHEKRDMPWRKTRNPYAIWISETMLQQTQVATVIPYYQRFLTRFPTLERLAAAEMDDVLRLWAGLGYYARARNLHRAARIILEQHDGRMPSTASEMRRLPGIGDYTAGAVASIAFGERTPVVDGNVARVIARLFMLTTDMCSSAGRESAWSIARQLVAPKRPGDFNQALMELGATLCHPGDQANCEQCPLRSQCEARKKGMVARLPVKSRSTAVRAETHVVAAIQAGDKWLFVRRRDDGLWGGLWEFPTTKIAKRTRSEFSDSKAASLDLVARCIPHAGAVQIDPSPFCDTTHKLSHRTIRFIGHVCRIQSHSITSRPQADSRWLPLSRSRSLGISAAMKRVVDSLAPRSAPAR